jgi:hypothetical protein
MENVKTIKDLVNVAQLTDGDYLAVSQPHIFNPVTEDNGVTRKATVKQLSSYILDESDIFAKKQDHIVGEYRIFASEPSEWELAKNRLLRLAYQIIEISDYQELCDRMYVGNSNNATANFWYKCSSGGARSTSGQYMRVADWRGMFMRGAGANAVFKAANDTPYDGKSIGSYQADMFQTHRHFKNSNNYFDARYANPNGTIITWDYGTGKVFIYEEAMKTGTPAADDYEAVVRIGNQTAPASISALFCITY